MSSTTVLGIEGTAWNLSVAIMNKTDIVAEVTAACRQAGFIRTKPYSITQSMHPV